MEDMVIKNVIENYKNKRVFITGHTGFKGSWLIYTLQQAGAIIKGYALEPKSTLSLFTLIEGSLKIDSVFADINDAVQLERELHSFQPDYVFHLAAQPLVRKSYRDPLGTFSTNILGTANVLNALRKLDKPCSCIIITTDKVYENKEWHYPYRETDRLGGSDPYSTSKACAELVINSYRNSFFSLDKYNDHKKSIASARAGNVIGGGDWAEDRLIPDIVTAIVNNKPIVIRNPTSVRPWQHVLEPVFGYLHLGMLLACYPTQYDGAWNFGPTHMDNLPVISIAEQAIKIWGKGEIDLQIDSASLHEAKLLKLDINKSINELSWKPKINASVAIELTINWYKSFYENQSSQVETLLNSDISYYKSIIN